MSSSVLTSSSKKNFSLDDFFFELPEDLIAQYPRSPRSSSRLLHVNNTRLHDGSFTDLLHLLDENDLLVVNNTRVLKARLFGRKVSGAKIEVLIERILGEQEAIAHIGANRPPKANTELILEKHLKAIVLGREKGLYHLHFPDIKDIAETLESCGHLPLPPYIQREAVGDDEERYQTVFAQTPGAVAAPTAGLHFDENLLMALNQKGVRHCEVTLHVGAGTFQPIREDLDGHEMHREIYHVSEEAIEAIEATRAKGGRIVACGTTALRALESAADEKGRLTPGQRETDLFIKPGYRFRVVDRLITNFHLPKTTLFILVSAFAGLENMQAAYAHAIAQEYRFFSYGDAMLLEKNDAI